MSLFNLKRFSIPSRNGISLKTAAIKKGAVLGNKLLSPSETGRTIIEPRQMLDVMDSQNVYQDCYSNLDARI